MNNKTELMNAVLYSMMNELSKEQLNQLKNQLQITLYDYDVSKIETAEISVGNCETTRELLEYFTVCKLSSGRSQKTIKQYILVACQLCDMVHKELNMITSDDVIYFLAKYPYTKTPNVSKCTMDSKRRYLSSIFTLLTKHKKIAENPMDMVEQIKYRSKVKQPLSEKEIEDILDATLSVKNKFLKMRNNAIVQLFLDSGVRVSELSGIDVDDVNFDRKEIKVLGKGNKERIVFFSNNTADILKEYLERRDIRNYNVHTPLFVDITNTKRLHTSGIQSMMKKLRKPSRVSRLHCHLLRASCATDLAKQGIAIDVIAKYLGHSGLDVIQRYVINSQEHIKNELQKVGLG